MSTPRYFQADLVKAVKAWNQDRTDANASEMVAIADALEEQGKYLRNRLAAQSALAEEF